MRSSSSSSATAAASSSAFVGIFLLILFAQCAPSVRIKDPHGSANGTLGNDTWPTPDRIVQHHPRVGKPAVEREKIGEASVITPSHDVFWNCMITAAHAFRNPRHGKLDSWKPQVHEMEGIAVRLQALEP